MAKRKIDRFLERHGRGWRYERAVPVDVRHLDPRSPKVRVKIDTLDLAEARRVRDRLSLADDALWLAYRRYMTAATPRQEYEAQQAVQDAARLSKIDARDFWRMTSQERDSLSDSLNTATMMLTGRALLDATSEQAARLLEDITDEHPLMNAAMSKVQKPNESLRDAFDRFVEEQAIALRDKSPQQRRKWIERRKRAVESFIKVTRRDMPVQEITRDDARMSTAE